MIRNSGCRFPDKDQIPFGELAFANVVPTCHFMNRHAQANLHRFVRSQRSSPQFQLRCGMEHMNPCMEISSKTVVGGLDVRLLCPFSDSLVGFGPVEVRLQAVGFSLLELEHSEWVGVVACLLQAFLQPLQYRLGLPNLLQQLLPVHRSEQ